MILYEFICQECRTEFEEFQDFSSSEKIICPKCKSTKVKKLLSAVRSQKSSDKAEFGSATPSCSPTAGFS